MTLRPSSTFLDSRTARGVGNWGRMRGPSSITSEQHIISWDSFETDALAALQWQQTLSAGMATSTVLIQVLPPRRVLNLTPPGIQRGNLVSQLAFILKTATNLNGRKALTTVPSTAILEVISFQQTLHTPVYAGQLNWCPSEWKRTMNSNIHQTNDNSLLTITVYTTK